MRFITHLPYRPWWEGGGGVALEVSGGQRGRLTAARMMQQC